jgi:hypothetical protein
MLWEKPDAIFVCQIKLETYVSVQGIFDNIDLRCIGLNTFVDSMISGMGEK